MFGSGGFPPGGFDPFEDMHRQMRMMQNIQSSLFSGMFSDPSEGMRAPQQVLPSSRHRARHTHVEEVPHDTPTQVPSRRSSQPIVEEPDDPPAARRRAPAARSHSRRSGNSGIVMDPFSAFTSGMGSGGAVYSYSSSYCSTGGPNGVTYEARKTHRVGPNGVAESSSTVRDGRTGQERIQVRRGLGERARIIERTRLADGQERRNEVLQGMQSMQDAQQFDREWMEAASVWPSSQLLQGQQPSSGRMRSQVPALGSSRHGGYRHA